MRSEGTYVMLGYFTVGIFVEKRIKILNFVWYQRDLFDYVVEQTLLERCMFVDFVLNCPSRYIPFHTFTILTEPRRSSQNPPGQIR